MQPPLFYLLLWTPRPPPIVDIIKVWYLAALGGAGRLDDAQRLLQRGQLPVDDVRVEVGVHVEVELVPAHKVAQLAFPQRALVPHARGRPHPLPQQRHGGLVVDSQVQRQSGRDMQNIIYQVSTRKKSLSAINPTNMPTCKFGIEPESVPLLCSAATRKGALVGVAGDVLRDLPDVVDEREVEQEVPRILALVTAQRANRR